MPIERVETLAAVASDKLAELRVKPDKTKAAKGLPRGSDQWNDGSVIAWIRKVAKTEAAAVAQLVAIQATAEQRLVGG
jgi:tetrahydromethanopterin S-methyltransferase subunit H